MESSGRGVAVNFGGKLILSGGAISNNTVASYGCGGGVLNDGIFSMSGGVISGNSVVTVADVYAITGVGGGVFTDNNGDFVLSGGVIDNNHAVSEGGGVYVSSYRHTETGIF